MVLHDDVILSCYKLLFTCVTTGFAIFQTRSSQMKLCLLAFQNGKFLMTSGNDRINRFCQFALNQLEIQLHPRSSPVYIPTVERNYIIRKNNVTRIKPPNNNSSNNTEDINNNDFIMETHDAMNKQQQQQQQQQNHHHQQQQQKMSLKPSSQGNESLLPMQTEVEDTIVKENYSAAQPALIPPLSSAQHKKRKFDYDANNLNNLNNGDVPVEINPTEAADDDDDHQNSIIALKSDIRNNNNTIMNNINKKNDRSTKYLRHDVGNNHSTTRNIDNYSSTKNMAKQGFIINNTSSSNIINKDNSEQHVSRQDSTTVVQKHAAIIDPDVISGIANIDARLEVNNNNNDAAAIFEINLDEDPDDPVDVSLINLH